MGKLTSSVVSWVVSVSVDSVVVGTQFGSPRLDSGVRALNVPRTAGSSRCSPRGCAWKPRWSVPRSAGGSAGGFAPPPEPLLGPPTTAPPLGPAPSAPSSPAPNARRYRRFGALSSVNTSLPAPGSPGRTTCRAGRPCRLASETPSHPSCPRLLWFKHDEDCLSNRFSLWALGYRSLKGPGSPFPVVPSSPRYPVLWWPRRGCLPRVPQGPLNTALRGGGTLGLGGLLDWWVFEVIVLCSVRGRPESPHAGSLRRRSPLVYVLEPVRILHGEGVAGSEVTGRGQRRGHCCSPKAPPPYLGTPCWDGGAGAIKLVSYFLSHHSTSPCLTSNCRPAWERGAGHRVAAPRVGVDTDFRPRRPLRRCLNPAGQVPAASRHQGPRAPPSPAPLGRAGVGNWARVEAGRAWPRVFGVCCRGFPGTRLCLRRPLPQGFVLTGNVVLLEGRGGQRTWARSCRLLLRPLAGTFG